MEPRFEPRGGIASQLHDLAFLESDNGLWAEDVPQLTSRVRKATMRDYPADSIEVEFIAGKTVQEMGKQALRTFFTLQASYLQEFMIFETLPDNVKEALRRKKIRTHEIENEEASIVIMTDSMQDEEIDEHEFDGYDDMNFRHVKRLQYNLNKNGHVRTYIETDIFEDTDDGDPVQIEGYEIVRKGSLKKDEAEILKKLEVQKNSSVTTENLAFFDIVEQYSGDKELSKSAKAEHHKAIETFLAFIRAEASAKDVFDLL